MPEQVERNGLASLPGEEGERRKSRTTAASHYSTQQQCGTAPSGGKTLKLESRTYRGRRERACSNLCF